MIFVGSLNLISMSVFRPCASYACFTLLVCECPTVLYSGKSRLDVNTQILDLRVSNGTWKEGWPLEGLL